MNKHTIQIAGWIILILSCVLWLAIAVIPWLGLTGKQIAGITTGLVIAGEITFYLGIFMVGKSMYQKLKQKLRFWKKNEVSDDENLNKTDAL